MPARRRVLNALAGALLVAPATRGAGHGVREPSSPRRSFTARTPDGLDIAVQTWGNPRGLPLLLIHGLNQCRLSWAEQLRGDLEERCHIVTYDLRGHGDSDKPADVRFYAEGSRWGDELASVIEAAGLDRPVLVGWSLGGVVLTNYLVKHGSARVAGINFVDAWTTDNPSLYTREAEVLALQLSSDDLPSRLAGIERFLEACFHARPDPGMFQTMLMFNAMPPTAVHKGIDLLSFHGADAALRALRVPVLVTHGAHDRLFPVAMSRYTAAAVPGAKLSVYADSGHSPFMEESGRFNAELAALIARAAS